MAGEDSLDCDCRIPNGDSLRLGYYRSPSGARVRVTDAARAGPPASPASPTTGTRQRRRALLRVARADLRPPAGCLVSPEDAPAPEAAGRPARNPLEIRSSPVR